MTKNRFCGNLSKMLSKRQKEPVIKEYQVHKTDTGSAEVQVGLITKRIKELALHLKKHPKDNHSRRGLLMMVGKRRKFLEYLRGENEKAYDKIVKKLKLEVA
ncbi:MAG: 30S ribosomal protein S15 [Candidatus Jorgensenbacteria bacterium GW2011_GWA1_48_13]|uniref:Small ribosomal subunit protein uS15 n=2 Tax=Candidatus Joergenseniibacteriota TaxID=1752739 RepID=A0A0G1W7U1_9BACT|nr:MAG: 30S ribosomal protein S15 [Candidatus Jorgensenbacteria bacterium GW2011_GWA1_48_13]KKW14773.1 MAG: 30S ribosomal protein S15 [Candidatus Jorgensenbacteria bacterium GW2011_GWB1_50_10]